MTRASPAAQDADGGLDVEFALQRGCEEVEYKQTREPSYELDLLNESEAQSRLGLRPQDPASHTNDVDVGGDASMISIDPLDVINEDIGDVVDQQELSRMSAGVDRLSIDFDQAGSDPPPGKPIESAAWSLTHGHITYAAEEQLSPPPAAPPKKEMKPDAKIWESGE